MNFFSIIIFFSFPFCINTQSIDLINSTCTQCAHESTDISYSFCSDSLQSIPISHTTNLQGLALIAMELAFGNATGTIMSIERMRETQQFDPYTLACLKVCLELYGEAVPMLASAVGAFLENQHDTAYLLVNAVMDMSSTCEEGFEEREGEVLPLTDGNQNLFQLGDVALCIINLLPIITSCIK